MKLMFDALDEARACVGGYYHETRETHTSRELGAWFTGIVSRLVDDRKLGDIPTWPLALEGRSDPCTRGDAG